MEIVALVCLVACTGFLFATFWSTGPITWDDNSNIFQNPYYHAGYWLPFWTEPYFGLYVPVTSTVWEMLFRVAGGEAWPFRVLNWALHLINTIFVCLLLKALARKWNFKSNATVFLGAAVFALHPLQVQAVAWISGGRDLLAGFFALATVLVYGRWRGGLGFLAATILFLLALLSKPNVVTLPLVLPLAALVLDREHLATSFRRAIFWLVLALPVIYMNTSAQAAHLRSVDLWQRPIVMFDTFAFYLAKLILPYPLSANYGRTPEWLLAEESRWWGAGLLIAMLIPLGMWACRRDRRYLLGLGWFILLLPVSGIVSFGYQMISTVADHYNYTPMAVIAIVTMLKAHRSFRNREWVYGFGIGLMILLSALSWERSRVWRDDFAFFTDMAEQAPDAYSTAIGMSIVMCEQKKDYEAGVAWTEKALIARPNDIMALANQAFCFLHARNYFRVIDMEADLDRLDLEVMERTQPTAYSSLLASIGTAMIETQQYEDGYQYLCEAYRVKPSEPNHARNLEIATQLLRRQGLQPSCDPSASPEEPASPPIQDPFDYMIPEEEFNEE